MKTPLRKAAAKAKPTRVEGAPIEKNSVFPVSCSCSGDPKNGSVIFQIAPMSAKSREDFTEWLKANGVYDAKAFVSDLKSKKASVKVGGVAGPVITLTFK